MECLPDMRVPRTIGEKENDMKILRNVRRHVLAVSLGLSVAVASGPARATNTTYKESAEVAARTSQTAKSVDKYVAQLDKTEQSLSAVFQAHDKDLKRSYQSFADQVSKLEEAQKVVTADIHAMKAKGVAYAASWDKANAQIENPELKEASIERRTSVMKSYDEVSVRLSDIEHQIQPFMGNLRDLRTFLGADLTPVHVQSASAAVQKSQADAMSLKQAIAPVQTLLRQLVNDAAK